ncbi:ABC transporter permease [Jeotgalibacillus proteolyticus]|uniref:Multidrug ABC transporter permease n=1 Tax=Jeotgalibacillus proteolyticus TaxID=2082395 RepID=A0A2S5GD04_9BACL|nr:ABC transporter permease [Jeotgalibacillus proteolyticus]PPA70869.1 hypothetical protein C4B60_08765 [Jeotgalibacillus proteolyticus]
MKSGILSLNKGLFQQQARIITWIGIFFTLALIIMLPLSILIRHLTIANSEYYPYSTGYQGANAVFDFSFPFQLIAFATFPILLAIILVSFMTKKAATDFMHSLPFTRQTILTNTYIVGALALLIPIVITGALLAILYPFLTDQFYSFLDIAGWMGLSYLIVLILFIFAIMIGMFVGNGLLHAGLTYLMIFVPASIIVLILFNLQYYVNGLALSNYAENLMTNGVFFIRLAMLLEDPFSLLEYVIYTLLAAAFVAISYIAYAKRPSEATDQTIVFPFFRYLFLYVLTFFAMLVSGFYFSEIQQGSFAWTLVGYLLGAFIAYTILQMILQKTLRLSWPWKGFVAYAVAVALLLIPVSFVAGFYERSVPEASEVTSVGVNQMYEERSVTMKGEESIQQVIELHRKLTEQSVRNRYNEEYISITYELNNGKSMTREYRVESELLSNLSEELRNNEEFKQVNEPIFAVKTYTDITYLSITNPYNGEEQRITELDQIDELLNAIENDVKEKPSRFYFNYRSSTIGEIYVNRKANNMDNYHSYLPIYADSTYTIDWLRENDFSDTLILPENIDQLAVLTGDYESNWMEIDEVMYGGSGNLEDIPGSKFITENPEEIEEILTASESGGSEDYIIIIPTTKGGGYQNFSFSVENAPAFIKDALPAQ